MSDTIASVKLTAAQAKRNSDIQKKDFKCPDVLILEPRGHYAGLFIELKTETPFKKDGTIKASKNDHLKGQLDTINKLKAKGYYATFSWGFDMTKSILDHYMMLPEWNCTK